MPILVCQCGQTLSVRDEHVGKMVRCPACGQQLLVAAGQGEPEPPAPRRPRPEDVQSARPAARPRRDPDDRGDEWEGRPPRGESLKTSGLAITSLVLGVASLGCLCL